jgi:hypothetical protein
MSAGPVEIPVLAGQLSIDEVLGEGETDAVHEATVQHRD